MAICKGMTVKKTMFPQAKIVSRNFPREFKTPCRQNSKIGKTCNKQGN